MKKRITSITLLEQFITTVIRDTLFVEAAESSYKGKSTKLGGGGRFASFVDRLKSHGYSEDQARRIAYKAGVKAHGKEQMAKWASAGRKRAEEKDEGLDKGGYADFDNESEEKDLEEKAPAGWEKTVKAMKKHKDITNPFALANYMKNKGYQSHKTDEDLVELDETGMFFDEEQEDTEGTDRVRAAIEALSPKDLRVLGSIQYTRGPDVAGEYLKRLTKRGKNDLEDISNSELGDILSDLATLDHKRLSVDYNANVSMSSGGDDVEPDNW